MRGIESRLKRQPKYLMGQAVITEVISEDKSSGLQFKNQVIGYISVIRATGTELDDTYEYGITTDMPGCYHNGKSPFKMILEDQIVIQE